MRISDLPHNKKHYKTHPKETDELARHLLEYYETHCHKKDFTYLQSWLEGAYTLGRPEYPFSMFEDGSEALRRWAASAKKAKLIEYKEITPGHFEWVPGARCYQSADKTGVRTHIPMAPVKSQLEAQPPSRTSTPTPKQAQAYLQKELENLQIVHCSLLSPNGHATLELHNVNLHQIYVLGLAMNAAVGTTFAGSEESSEESSEEPSENAEPTASVLDLPKTEVRQEEPSLDSKPF